MRLRPYVPADLPGVVAVCIQTGDSGGDARFTFPRPELLAQYFAIPYLAFAPRSCLVLEDSAGVAGYVLGVPDTHAYVRWFNQCWLPGVQGVVRQISPEAESGAAWLRELILRPSRVSPAAGTYPAHGHIDLLPRVQGQGWGRRMLQHWAWLIAGQGARGFHLGVAPANTRAQKFYAKLGLRRLRTASGAVEFGLHLPWAAAQPLR